MLLALAIGRRVSRKSACKVRSSLGSINRFVSARQLDSVYDRDSVTSALEPLRMAKKLDPYRETARMALEPWLVETALARLGRTLSPAEQRTIINATRTPHKVSWPEWWSEKP